MIASEDGARAYVAGLCGAAAMEKLDRLVEALREENGRQNLVAKASLDVVWQRHIADSAQLIGHVPRETRTWMDLGSGAGFPGLVIAAMLADAHIILVESRRKRIEWLERIAGALELGNVRIEGKRLEQVETVPVGSITARAFAPLDAILALSARFSTERTYYVLPKGRSAAQELQDMPRRIRRTFHVEQSLTDPEAGILVGRLSKEARARL